MLGKNNSNHILSGKEDASFNRFMWAKKYTKYRVKVMFDRFTVRTIRKTKQSTLHYIYFYFFLPLTKTLMGNKLIKLKHVSRCKPAAWKEETKFLIRVNDSSINEFYIRNSYDKK